MTIRDEEVQEEDNSKLLQDEENGEDGEEIAMITNEGASLLGIALSNNAFSTF